MSKNKQTEVTLPSKPGFNALPKELGMLLQIDLLMGRKRDFNRRLAHALNDLAKIVQDAKTSIKH